MSATNSSAFVIFLEFYQSSVEEITIENATTKEQLTIRNAIFKKPNEDEVHYAEILRHPTGANQEWIGYRAYYERMYNDEGEDPQVICIESELTIG